MSSQLAWLDTSAEERRRMQDLIGIFRDTESRDELGIGQIRDVWSDTLFPGTSTLHTRARYLLFVPWCYQSARSDSASAVHREERRLLAAMLDSGHKDGLIGAQAGVAVKTLPSTIYHTALARYGIAQEGGVADGAVLGDEGELLDRGRGEWHPTLPQRPRGFPREADGFELPGPEAAWLRERIVDATDGSLLAHLLLHPEPPDADSGEPWSDPACRAATGDPAAMLHHAELFSLTMHGALLLYNLMVARRYEAAGHCSVDCPVHRYTQELDDWANRCASDPRIAEWDRAEFWDHVRLCNPRVNPATRGFVDVWLDACAKRPSAIPRTAELHDLVAHRERVRKKAQSRLSNPEMLRRWTGASGTRPLSYRWAQVRRMVRDITRALEAPDAAA